MLLPTASFYKALGKDEKKMATISFRLLSLLTFLIVIVSIPVGKATILRLFPEYAGGLRAFDLLIVATVLPYYYLVVNHIRCSGEKDLKPILVLSVINGGLVVSTSYLLIPRLGIIGVYFTAHSFYQFVSFHDILRDQDWDFLYGENESAVPAITLIVGHGVSYSPYRISQYLQ